MSFDLLPSQFHTLSDGARLRYTRLEPSSSPRGTILIVPGRREFIEKKFFELAQPLLEKGYRLIFVEMRGQGLSTRHLTGDQHQRDHSEDFNLAIEDLRSFFKTIVKPDMTAPVFVHGHSLGGHYLLRWLSEDNPPVSGAFVTAPMLALAGVPAHLTAHGISWVGVRLFGHSTDYAPLQYNYGADDRHFITNPLTHDPERFLIIENYFTAHPELTVGGVTWGWVLAALQSMHLTHAKPYLSKINIPVLALTGDEDRVTPASEISRYLNNIPRVRSHIISSARHDVMNETAPLRAQAWSHIDAFLDNLTSQ